MVFSGVTWSDWAAESFWPYLSFRWDRCNGFFWGHIIWLSCWELWALPLTVSAVSHSSLPLWSSPLLGEPYPQHFHTGSIQHLLWNGKRIFYMTSQRKYCYLLAQLSSFLSHQFSNIMNKNSVCLKVDKKVTRTAQWNPLFLTILSVFSDVVLLGLVFLDVDVGHGFHQRPLLLLPLLLGGLQISL